MRYLTNLASLDLSPLPRTGAGAGGNALTTVLGIFFAILGGIAVLVVTLAGFKYVISRGNPQETEKAKNTILYAIIGLAVCIIAESVIKFALDRLS